MEITEQEEQLVKVNVVKSILCNKCSKEILNDISLKGTYLVSDFGWGSNKDGLMEKFHLCDECYDDLIDSFQIKPTEL